MRRSLLLVLLCLGSAAAQPEDFWDVVPIRADPPAFSRGDVTFVPLRLVAEHFGAHVRTEGPRITITAADGRSILLAIGDAQAEAAGEGLLLEAPPTVVGGVTFVPLRFVAEALGAEVRYLAALNEVRLRLGDARLALRVPPASSPSASGPAPAAGLPHPPTTLRGGAAVEAYLRQAVAAAAASDGVDISLEELGRSQQGRPIQMLVVRGRNATLGRRLLAVGAQHGDEPAGTRGLLQLLRRLAATSDPAELAVLDRVTLHLVPISNPDAVARFARPAANGVNMNRDWQRQALPETQAIAAAIARYQPDVVLDLHEQTPRDREGTYVLGMGPGVADLNRAIRSAFRRHGISTRVSTAGQHADARLLHRWFPAAYGRPGFLVESKWSRPERDLERRSLLHRVTVWAVAEALAQR